MLYLISIKHFPLLSICCYVLWWFIGFLKDRIYNLKKSTDDATHYFYFSNINHFSKNCRRIFFYILNRFQISQGIVSLKYFFKEKSIISSRQKRKKEKFKLQICHFNSVKEEIFAMIYGWKEKWSATGTHAHIRRSYRLKDI